MADSRPNPKREDVIPGDYNRRGPLKSSHKPSQLPAHVSNILSQNDPRVSGETGDGDRRPQGQAATTSFGHEGGGPIRGLSGSPEDLRHLIPGKVPRPYCSVQGQYQDGLTASNVLGPPDHGD